MSEQKPPAEVGPVELVLGPLPEPATMGTFPGPHGYSKEQMRAYAAQERAAERERCAKLAEGAQQLPNSGDDFANGWCSAALQIAQAIRA